MLTTPWHINFSFGKELGSEDRKGATVTFTSEDTYTENMVWLQKNPQIKPWWFKLGLASGFPQETLWCPVFEMMFSAGKTSEEPYWKDILRIYLIPLHIASFCRGKHRHFSPFPQSCSSSLRNSPVGILLWSKWCHALLVLSHLLRYQPR